MEADLSDPHQDAANRLTILAKIMSVLTLVYLFLYSILPALGGPQLGEDFGYLDVLTIVAWIISCAVILLVRSRRFAARQVLDIGLWYELALGVLIGVGIKLPPGAMRVPDQYGVSEMCILILIFPLIVSNTPRKIFTVSLIIASLDPLGAWLAGLTGNPVPSPTRLFAAYWTNYVCAFLALIPSLILHRLGQQVDQARELGSYRLHELLGEGGMGEVWRASHQLLAREAAVKIVRPESFMADDGSSGQAASNTAGRAAAAAGAGAANGDREAGASAARAATAQRRFEREAQATANLHSHHTIQLYDFGTKDDGTFFYVMELLDGLDLRSFVDRFGPVAPERVIYLLCQVCDSLWDAHRSNLIHRDIKPANIYVCRYGHEVDFVKVLDFGLVKPTGTAASELSQLTMSHTVTGTPAFMAPEMTLGRRDVDGRADLYALGCVGYWLLTGQPVFEGETTMQVLASHLQDTPVAPSQRTELRVPSQLDAVILSCLEKDPDRRPQTAEQLRSALAAVAVESHWTEQRAQKWWSTHLPA